MSLLIDKDLPLASSDYDEFGNPFNDALVYSAIKNYSPYENIHSVEYPATLIICGSEDYRTPVWNAIKYAKKFRERVATPNKIHEISMKNLLFYSLETGHHGEAGISSGLKENSLTMSFLDYIVLKANKEI